MRLIEVLLMPIHALEEFNRYTISMHDFEHTLELLAAAKKHRSNTIEFEALLSMAIISFCRPFSPNERNKSSKAAPSLPPRFLSTLSDLEKAALERYKRLRNTAIAHSEFQCNPTEYTTAGYIWSRPFSILNEDHDLDSLTNLVKKFREQCHERASGIVPP
jgi:hypothetical protein